MAYLYVILARAREDDAKWKPKMTIGSISSSPAYRAPLLAQPSPRLAKGSTFSALLAPQQVAGTTPAKTDPWAFDPTITPYTTPVGVVGEHRDMPKTMAPQSKYLDTNNDGMLSLAEVKAGER